MEHRPSWLMLEPERERYWARQALGCDYCSHAYVALQLNALSLELAKAGGLDAIIDHPSVAVMTAHLAEVAGLHYRYPIHLRDELMAFLEHCHV
ncbi:MAG: hypothetical protein WBM08_05650 [Prochlorococcaceae cyanobacterium]